MAHQEGEGWDDCPDHPILLIYCIWMGAEPRAIKGSQPAVACVITNTNSGDPKLICQNSATGVFESLLSAEVTSRVGPWTSLKLPQKEGPSH